MWNVENVKDEKKVVNVESSYQWSVETQAWNEGKPDELRIRATKLNYAEAIRGVTDIVLICRWSQTSDGQRAGALSSRSVPERDHRDRVHHAAQGPVNDRRVPVRQDGEADHQSESQLHGPAARIGAEVTWLAAAGRRFIRIKLFKRNDLRDVRVHDHQRQQIGTPKTDLVWYKKLWYSW